jgi:hypothetical protein
MPFGCCQPDPYYGGYQQVYSAADFPSKVEITALAFASRFKFFK